MQNEQVQNQNGKANGGRKMEVSQQATEVLKTLELLEYPHGPSYLVRVLGGYSLVKPEHRQLETFGALSGHDSYYLRMLISRMVDRHFLAPANKMAATLEITPAGQQFLADPQDWWEWAEPFRKNPWKGKLFALLRNFRTETADAKRIAPYEVITDFSMSRIIHLEPTNQEALREIPGIGWQKAEAYGSFILQFVEQVQSERSAYRSLSLKEKVQSPTYQQTKELFEEGKAVHEIAQVKGVKESTVRRYLIQLHKADELDLRPWIEENIDSKELYRASEYFKETDNPKLREAFEVLGLDFRTLELCQLYVSDFQSETTKIAV